MSILRIVTGPADVGVGGYTFDTATNFDPTRVTGCFKFDNGDGLLVTHDAPASSSVWYHLRYALALTDSLLFLVEGVCFTFRDANSNVLGSVDVANATLRANAIGTTTASTGYQTLAMETPYSFDFQIVVGATTTIRWYINGALIGERTVNSGVGFGVARSVSFNWNDTSAGFSISEIICADEDTRGMRVRELRPKSFGIFQEWDGSINALRDTDLATGISTDVANRRVSFGISNIEEIESGDVINRVVAQTYAQKGESGLSAFNHFFRYRDATTRDGADQSLSTIGTYFREEFLTNPKTSLPWVPEDFRSLQTGVRSRT